MEKNSDNKVEEQPHWKQLLVKNRSLVIGFSAILLVIIFIIVISAVFRQRTQIDHQDQSFDTRQTNQGQSGTQAEWPMLWGTPDNQSKCKKIPSVKFTSSPVAIADIAYVEPIGELREGHIAPGGHAGIDYKTSPTTTPVKVFAPADGFLVRVEKHPYIPPPGYPPLKHYHVYLEHSCTFFTGFVHLTEFSPELLAASKELAKLNADTSGQFKNIALRIPVKAGQQLGTAWSFGLLGWVTVDLTVTNKGYLKPQSYRGENWRIHSVSGFDYFEGALKTQIMAKNPRTSEPRGGKIDFDIEGKLVGNWFEEGTGGFRDENVMPKQCGNFPCPYWDGHIAFVYDYVGPSELRVSVGHDWGLSGRTPFGVKGNRPDFKDIGAADGLVKYELVSLKDISLQKGYDAQSSLITASDDSKTLGVLLVQVVDNDTIRVEVFSGKTKDQVSSFTAKARVYHR